MKRFHATDPEAREAIKAISDIARAEFGPLPESLEKHWGPNASIIDPRIYGNYCSRQARRTPSIPWHNGKPCIACKKG